MDLYDPTLVATSLALTAAFIVASIAYWIRCLLERKKPFEGLPMPDKSHWLHGHAFSYFSGDFQVGNHHLSAEFANENGLNGHWLGSLPIIGVSNYKVARHILMTEYSRRNLGLFERHLCAFGGSNNFLMANGKTWKLKRDAITRTFDQEFMVEAQQATKEISDDLVTSLKAKLRSGEHPIMDIQPLMKMVTLDVFGKMAFNTNFGSCRTLAPSKLAMSFDFLIQEFARRLSSPMNPANLFYWLPTPTNLLHKQKKDVIHSFVDDLINERRSMKKTDNGMLSRLMHAQSSLDKSATNIFSQSLIDDIMLLLFAGYDTTSITLTYALYMMAMNPEVQQLCMSEVDSAKNLGSPSELTFCTAVIQETLRLYPPGPQTSRTMQRAKTIDGGFVIPKDAYVMVFIWSIHRDEAVFPKPLEFRPDRWVKLADDDIMEETSTYGEMWVERASMEEPTDEPGCTIAAANRKAFFPFSAGGRSCAGQRFAMDEAVIVLANLVKHFKFSPVPDFELGIELRGILQTPQNGIPLIVEERTTE